MRNHSNSRLTGFDCLCVQVELLRDLRHDDLLVGDLALQWLRLVDNLFRLFLL